MTPGPSAFLTRQMLATVVVVAAAYGYFLLFAEFALIELARPYYGDDRALRPFLIVLGGSGLVGSYLGAVFYSPARIGTRLAATFVAAGVAAVASLVAGRATFWLVAMGTGLSTGAATVLLASGLRAQIAPGRLGLGCGIGTGLAYAFVNLPTIFSAGPNVQGAIAAVIALVGAGAAWTLASPGVLGAREDPSDWIHWAGWIVIFAALVWLDSAGFFVIQHSASLKGLTWRDSAMLWGNAATHLLGAVVVGYLLDAGRLRSVVCFSILLLAATDALLGRSGFAAAGLRLAYTTGVSAYSVALVYLSAGSGRPLRSALLFSLAGWLSSALGIGMVQQLHEIPLWFPVLAAGLVLITLLVQCPLRPTRTAGLALAATGAAWLAGPGLCAQTGDPQLGREVYIAEGCINCHSQYVRPSVSHDVLWWGPARPLATIALEDPPLIGLRRQGPDLMNVGNRRSSDWEKIHLLDPRITAPGSRMPSYRHLFTANNPRGPDLVAYLASLGADTVAARWNATQDWTPSQASLTAPFDLPSARTTYATLCATCHGESGRGDGPTASQLNSRPPDFSLGKWVHFQSDDPNLIPNVARTIKFGVPGTAMAGHEYLDDTTLVDLARVINSLHH